VKTISQIVTAVAAGALVLGAIALAPDPGAAQQRPNDPTRPDYQTGDATRPYYQRSQAGPTGQAGASRAAGSPHVDAHVNAHVEPGPDATADRTRRQEVRPEDARDDSRWTPGAERYTRPPHRWWR
jgi:hypothetical protein